MLAFRELLRVNQDLLRRYAERKEALIKMGRDKNPEYTAGKNDLIEAALRRASITSSSQ
jgi:GrpB-like predicted nucleotidyltransferase (UPF0157 family)